MFVGATFCLGVVVGLDGVRGRDWDDDFGLGFEVA